MNRCGNIPTFSIDSEAERKFSELNGFVKDSAFYGSKYSILLLHLLPR